VFEQPLADSRESFALAVLHLLEQAAAAQRAREGASPPAMPMNSSREGAPLCSCSISTRWRASGLRGRKAERSAL
jgi:hypothetical protein